MNFSEKIYTVEETFIPLCLESHGRYYFNILRMMPILYHMYIKHEIYHTTHKKAQNFINEHKLIEGTISK